LKEKFAYSIGGINHGYEADYEAGYEAQRLPPHTVAACIRHETAIDELKSGAALT